MGPYGNCGRTDAAISLVHGQCGGAIGGAGVDDGDPVPVVSTAEGGEVREEQMIGCRGVTAGLRDGDLAFTDNIAQGANTAYISDDFYPDRDGLAIVKDGGINTNRPDVKPPVTQPVVY